ncbi:TNS3 [Cordylochernes scorpioides]|uniref:TNS3 n=1 Tax=Cordylochernes scorpioides TaxID=51811 RepID=A0ABY6LVK6_9ARAC|nr:TNS3 [Cordylochernes scorpioides]
MWWADLRHLCAEPSEVITSHPTFVKDSSRLWYRPNISRDEAIDYLRNKPAGTFIIRDSNSFPGAYGLALKVATPPAKVQPRADNTWRHRYILEYITTFIYILINPNGYNNIKDGKLGNVDLILQSGAADEDFQQMAVPQQKELLQQGAACSVIYLNTVDTECLTGPQAVKRALAQTFTEKPSTSQVHFKVSSQGITITDNDHKLFFRRHYPIETVSHCGLDPEDRKWVRKNEETGLPIGIGRCFGFVAKKPASKTDNQCHVFAELDPEQPAQAIVNFVSRVMSSALQEHQQKVQEQESF